MPPLTIHDASVPVFSRGLQRLAVLLTLAQAHAQAHALEPAVLLDARLAPTMLPFAMQVETAAQFSLRACAPLAQLAVPPHGKSARSFAALAERVTAARFFLDALTPNQMEGAAERLIESRAGEATLALPGREFLLHDALPNFYFHLTAAYCILRQQGVPVGKGDFDGFHVYAPAA
jgi:hypothetical protein